MAHPFEDLHAIEMDPRFRDVNWDSYGAQPISAVAIETARTLLNYGPAVVPTSHGGIQLEWHAGNLDLEVEIDATGRPIHCFAQRASDGVDLTKETC